MNEVQISDWHNLSKFPISKDIATKRSKAFEEILACEEKKYWVDIVRCFFDLNVDGENINNFIKTFQTNDDSIPRLKIEKLIKALAAMALTAKIQEALMGITGKMKTAKHSEEEIEVTTEDEPTSNCEIANVISNALINATFLKQFKVETKIPILQSAVDFLNKYSSEDRNLKLDVHETAIMKIEQRISEEEEEITTEINIAVVRAAQAILKSNNIQKEELNILWWLFGEYSGIAGDYFVNVEKKAMSIIAARELHNLSQFTSEIPASNHLLRKILSLTKSDKFETTAFSLKECIESLNIEVRKKIIGNYTNSVDELTPCMEALLKAGETVELKNMKINLNEKLDLSVLSSQFYKELTFLSTI